MSKFYHQHPSSILQTLHSSQYLDKLHRRRQRSLQIESYVPIYLLLPMFHRYLLVRPPNLVPKQNRPYQYC